MPPLNNLEQDLGHNFADKTLLKLALIHSSTHKRKKDGQAVDNERLEFLGDRVLGLVIADCLLSAFPKDPEGSLARRHTALVRKETLARVAQSIDLGAYIEMTPAEEAAGGRNNAAILSNACEAVIAALYLDGGLVASENFIRSHWLDIMNEDLTPPKDNKTALQEWAQGRGLPLPIYQVVNREGPAHAPHFTIEVCVKGIEGKRATGASKRIAEQAAAGELLKTVLEQ